MKLTIYAGWLCLLDHSHPMLLLLDVSGEWEEAEMHALSAAFGRDDDDDARISAALFKYMDLDADRFLYYICDFDTCNFCCITRYPTYLQSERSNTGESSGQIFYDDR